MTCPLRLEFASPFTSRSSSLCVADVTAPDRWSFAGRRCCGASEAFSIFFIESLASRSRRRRFAFCERGELESRPRTALASRCPRGDVLFRASWRGADRERCGEPPSSSLRVRRFSFCEQGARESRRRPDFSLSCSPRLTSCWWSKEAPAARIPRPGAEGSRRRGPGSRRRCPEARMQGSVARNHFPRSPSDAKQWTAGSFSRLRCRSVECRSTSGLVTRDLVRCRCFSSRLTWLGSIRRKSASPDIA